MSEDKDAEIARLEAEVAKLTRDWEAMNKAADRFCADWKRAESRLSALAAAAREYRDAEESRYSALAELEDRQDVEAVDHRPDGWPETKAYKESVRVLGEKRKAIDALLSGEEGR